MAGYIYGSKVYQATCPLVIAKLISGGDVYVYKHQLLPTDTDPMQIEDLLRNGLIVTIEDPAA